MQDIAAMSIDQEAADWFARLRGPDVDASRAAFEQWYAVPEHSAAYEHLARTWDQAKFLANTPTGRARNLDLARPGHRRGRAIALGAGALLAASFAVLLLGRLTPQDRLPGTAAPPVVAAATHAPRTIALADGSQVILDRAARIEIAFDGAVRRVRMLAGRARFDVAHDTARPFVVEAEGGSVIAHGTMFDVAVAPGGFDVALLRCTVDVRDGGPGAPAHVQRLVSGQKVALRGGALAQPVAMTALDTQWAQPVLDFDATPLADAVAAFNRTSRRVVRIDPAAAGRLRVTGTFRRDDPETFAGALAATFDLRVRHNPDASLTLVSSGPRGGAKKP